MAFYTYILASKRNGTLYTGMTDNLPKRVHQHKTGSVPGFTAKYGVAILFWFENHELGAALSNANARSRNGAGPGSCGSSKKTIRIGSTSTAN